MLLGSALSAQVGAAVGQHRVPGDRAGRRRRRPTVRLGDRAARSIARPRLWAFTWFQWRPTILLGLVFGVMNFGLYTAVDRIGLGLAVTLEFLGPLAVALATAWTVRTAAIAALAVVGVVLLTDPSPTTDWIGVGAGLLAAGCWAAYILLNREVGRRLPGVQGSAAAATLSALCFIPIGIVTFVHHPPTVAALVAAVVVGLLSSVVPQIADLVALRRLPAAVFGILMSAHPVFAALVGLVGLGQHLGVGQWAGIGIIIAANIASVLVAARSTAAPPIAEPATEPALSVPRSTMAE